MKTHILGDGVAAMMLASRANELPEHDISIVHPHGAPMSRDHMLGFWNMDGLESAVECSRASWPKWAVITDTGKSIMHSQEHAYHIMHKANYLQTCREMAEQNGVAFIEESHINAKDQSQTFDSRPPRASKNAMLQHFLGQEVEVNKPVFDTSTAILMDFRVDQSQGMHFIYLLPYSPTQALVESTLFTTTVSDREYYLDAIENYLMDRVEHPSRMSFTKNKVSSQWEHCQITNLPGLGANAGAIVRQADTHSCSFINKFSEPYKHQTKASLFDSSDRTRQLMYGWTQYFSPFCETGHNKGRNYLEEWLHHSQVMNLFDS